MPGQRVLVLFNEPVLPIAHPDAASEHEILYTVEVVSKSLIQEGFKVTRLGVSADPGVLTSALCCERPDAVFNLFEGMADHGHTEACVAGILEWFGIPFTGCPSQALDLARCKHLSKLLFQGAGLPTPEFFVIDALPVPECRLGWPVIVKPALEDASVGVDQGSVVTGQRQLEERVASLLESYGPPVLVERYIHGRELNVALVETASARFLPIGEIVFVEKRPGYWPIVTFDAKWRPESPEFEGTPARYPAAVSPKLAERLRAIARRAFGLLGCRDYARADLRVSPQGKPYLLEVNPNPDYHPTAGLAGGMASVGLSHDQFTVELVRAALLRGAIPRSPADDRQEAGVFSCKKPGRVR
jgi:D-alanine-D-alanine ligase